jgi:hypothetical protein
MRVLAVDDADTRALPFDALADEGHEVANVVDGAAGAR